MSDAPCHPAAAAGVDPEAVAMRTVNRASMFVGGVALVLAGIAAFAWTPAVAPALGYLVVALCVWSHDRWLIAFAFMVSLVTFLIMALMCAGSIIWAIDGTWLRVVAAALAVGMCGAAGCVCLSVADAWSVLRPHRPDPRRGFEVILAHRSAAGPVAGPDAQPEGRHG